jgi:hypothetical protein
LLTHWKVWKSFSSFHGPTNCGGGWVSIHVVSFSRPTEGSKVRKTVAAATLARSNFSLVSHARSGSKAAPVSSASWSARVRPTGLPAVSFTASVMTTAYVVWGRRTKP